MKLLGKRSLSSFLKILLDIAFYGIFVAFVLLIVAVVVARRSDNVNTSQNFGVFFDLDPAIYEIESSAGPHIETELTDASGNLVIRGGRFGLLLVPVLILLPPLVAVLIVLHRLRRIFRRLIERRPFAAENAKNLRFIGLVIIAGELVFATATYWSTRFVVSEFTASGVTLHADFDVRMPIILAGLVLLIIAEVFREGAQMKSDLEAAREIQFSLVSDTEYQAGPVSIHSEMQPADSVGGDYYDVIDLNDGRIAFVVADVAGHGLPAALLMALLQGSLRSLISSGLRGAELVSKLNTYLVANIPKNRMITFFYGELDPSTGQLSYVNAGHNPPYLYDSSGSRRLDSTGVVLGAVDGMPFAEASVELRDGARVLLFTDGIVEAANPADEEFGEERLERLIGEQGDLAPARLIDRAVADVIKFCGKTKPADDMTMMVVTRSDSARAH